MDEAERSPLQPERDAKAARELARAAGIALLEMSAALDEGLGVKDGAGAVTFVLVAFAARARRLLRSAYRLVDAGERDAAVPLFRVMSEYLIVGRWLFQVGEAGMETWAMDDLRRRRTIACEIREKLEKLDPGDPTIATLDPLIAEMENAMRRYGGPNVALTKKAAKKAWEKPPPSLEAMAVAVGLDFAYSSSYRIQSQSDVHASPLATDYAYDQTPEGLAVRPIPHFADEHLDSYALGAHLLLDIIRPLSEKIPELGWAQTTALVAETLQAISAPRRAS